MKRASRTRSHSIAAGICAAMAAGAPALAVDIPPGGAASLPGGSIAGTVVRDVLVPFAIRDGGTIIMEGIVQDRVIRTASGTLAFIPRLRDVKGSTPFGIDQVVRSGFESFSTDVDWSITGLGSGAPTFCQRSGDGDVLDYSLSFSPIFSGQESRFFWAATDADVFNTSGRMTLRLENGLSATITVAAPVFDSTPPTVAITSPGAFDCGCNTMQIRGTIADAESGIASWTLEYARESAGPWSLIASGSSAVGTGGLIASWNTTGLAQGDYLIRLTASNGAEMTSVVTSAVFVDNAFGTVDVRTPVAGGVYGGRICFDGTVADHCGQSYRVDWRPAAGGAYQPVDPSTPVYPGAVVNDPLADWAAGSVADGLYQVRVRGEDTCGNIKDDVRTIEIDNTPPVAIISAPDGCEYLCGRIVFRGTASDANIRAWSLQYTGGDERGWRTIATGSTNVVDGVLGTWDTTGLRPCAYTVRLVVTDESIVNCTSRHDVRDRVSFNVGAYADCDGNGVLDFFDFLCFQNAFATGCP
ncbi:MAG: hypothetical protein ACF8R7_18210 [Phycisphaerales bacterium JB039]